MNRFIYILFITTMFLISCSGLDETSNLGKKFVTDNSPDSLNAGVYKTIYLTQDASTFKSIADTLSGKHIYQDSLQNNGNVINQWAIGNWNNEKTTLKLTHYKDTSDTNSIKEHLLKLLDESAFDIKAQIIWDNVTNYNSYDNAAVEIGAIFNGTSYFPLNFASVYTKNSSSSVDLTLETYLLNEKNDSTEIERYDVVETNFTDTILIDSVYNKNTKSWELSGTPDSTRKADLQKRQSYKSDTLISWKNYVDTSSYCDSVTYNNDSTIITFYDEDTIVGTVKHKNSVKLNDDSSIENYDPSITEFIYDTLIIDIDTTFAASRRIVSTDSERKYMKLVSSKTPDTLIQTGKKYKVALNDPQKGIRMVGGNGVETIDVAALSDTLNMYLRIDANTNIANILHLSEPKLYILYKKINGNDTTQYYQTVDFTEMSVETKSSDVLKDTDPVISGALERFAEVNLDLSDFFDEVKQGQFLSVGLANLTLSLDSKTDFPAQYGDSIYLNAIVSSKKLTPETIFKLNSSRKVNRFLIKRDSSSVKIPLASTITDYVYEHRIFEKTAPSNAYLYMWIDGWVMGRIYFKPSDNNNAEFTYILQTRKGGE